MEITKEGIYLTFLFYQLVMILITWIEAVKSEHTQEIRMERLKLTARTVAVSLLTVGGYFIGEETLWVEWIVGLVLFSLLLILTFKLVDFRKNWFNEKETYDNL